MSQEDIFAYTIKKIEAEAKRKAEELNEKARDEAKKILANATQEAENTKRQRIAQEKERLEFELSQEVNALQIRTKHMELHTINEILESIKAEMLARLANLGAEKKREIIGRMLRIAKQQIPDGVVYSNAQDEGTVKGFAVYPYRGNIKCAGGILVEEKNGERVLDLRYEHLIELIFEKHGEEIYRMLFE
jgi:V/A-type H+-transporting ATPase subunit E